MAIALDNLTEWLESDGLGGFASGTTCGERTRRYHALLQTATTPPTGRMVLVGGFDAWVETLAGRLAISTQRYAPDVIYPDGTLRLAEFTSDPWPQWTYRFGDNTTIVQELFVPHGIAACCLRWTLQAGTLSTGGRGQGEGEEVVGCHGQAQSARAEVRADLESQNALIPHTGRLRLPVPPSDFACPWHPSAGEGETQSCPPSTLMLRPLLCGRDYHSLHHENPAFRFNVEHRESWLVWHPYDGVPGICLLTNANYSHEPEWYRNFLYEQEQERGLDCVEDLASPGTLHWNLSQGAVLIFAAEGADAVLNSYGNSADDVFAALAKAEQHRRSQFTTPLHRSADAYLAGRSSTWGRLSCLSNTDSRQAGKPAPRQTGQTIIAGYPWFTDWGRDTFISLRGLCLATGRIDDALQILLAWASTVSEGMLPNRFPDAGDQPEFNSVDASLWFIIAVHDLLDGATRRNRLVSADDRRTLEHAVLAIVEGYAGGTRFGIRMDSDALLAAGQPGVQLTWMDAKVGDWVVTPRIGKPVEVQSLWLNALWIAGRLDRRWTEPLNRGRAEFDRRFWNPALDCLYDVIDVDHQPGTTDAAVRPNQIFAVGGLPLALMHGQRARSVVDAVENRLLTPLGLRTLAPGSPNYATQCVGGPSQRDAAYHQGTVWPWLIGPFVEAWLRVRGGTTEAKAEARQRFLPPLETHLQSAGLGHISEIADAEPPFTPRGCPFQAWSLGEFLRLRLEVLAE